MWSKLKKEWSFINLHIQSHSDATSVQSKPASFHLKRCCLHIRRIVESNSIEIHPPQLRQSHKKDQFNASSYLTGARKAAGTTAAPRVAGEGWISLGLVTGGAARHGQELLAWSPTRVQQTRVRLTTPMFYDAEGTRYRD